MEAQELDMSQNGLHCSLSKEKPNSMTIYLSNMIAIYLYVLNPPVLKIQGKEVQDHHMTTHHLKNYRYPCTEEICTKGYDTQDALDWHRYKVHNIDKPVICDLCNKEVLGKKYLEIRHKLTCGQPKDIKCRDAQCKKKFKAQFLMDSHYVKWNTDQGKVFVCEDCGAKLGTKFTYRQHMWAHSVTRKESSSSSGSSDSDSSVSG